MTALQWLNVSLALLGAVAAFGSLNKMRARETRPCIIGAVLLLALGLAAQALGELASQWAPIADTATFGGIFALLLASQRVHSWALERWANPIASLIALVAGIVFLAGLLGG